MVRTGPFAALEEVHVAVTHGRAEHVPVREPHDGPGEPEHDERDEHQAEFLQQAVGGQDGRYRVGHVGRSKKKHCTRTKKILQEKYKFHRLFFAKRAVGTERVRTATRANYCTGLAISSRLLVYVYKYIYMCVNR